MSEAILRWEEPAPSRGRGRRSSIDWQAAVEQLQQHPGEFALIHESEKNGSHRAKPFKEAGCEIKYTTGEDGMRRVYARWPKEATE